MDPGEDGTPDMPLNLRVVRENAEAEAIIRVSYSDDRAAEWLASRTDLPVVALPATVDYHGGQTLTQWYDELIKALLQ